MKKYSILDKLFLCLVLNMIPLLLLTIFNVPSIIYSLLVILMFGLQTLIMFMEIKDKIVTIDKKYLKLYGVLLVSQIIAQVFNIFRNGSILIQDIGNMIAVFTNIFMFIIVIFKCTITKADFYKFMKNFVYLGVALCIINLLNIDQMVKIFSVSNSYSLNISSIFPNRNQFGLFLIMASISNTYLLFHDFKKPYLYIQILFIINIFFTMSRNAILAITLFTLFVLYLNKQVILKNVTFKHNINFKKLAFLFIAMILLLIVFVPDIRNTINTLFIRANTIDFTSGRLAVWIGALNIFMINPIFGVGRFRALDLNATLFNNSLSHFHNLFLETLVGYGIIGFILFVALLYFIFKKVNKSSFKVEKNILIAGLCVYLFMSLFESTTRFAIGYTDYVCMMYFFTIPLLFIHMKDDSTETGCIDLEKVVLKQYQLLKQRVKSKK